MSLALLNYQTPTKSHSGLVVAVGCLRLGIVARFVWLGSRNMIDVTAARHVVRLKLESVDSRNSLSPFDFVLPPGRIPLLPAFELFASARLRELERIESLFTFLKLMECTHYDPGLDKSLARRVAIAKLLQRDSRCSLIASRALARAQAS